MNGIVTAIFLAILPFFLFDSSSMGAKSKVKRHTFSLSGTLMCRGQPDTGADVIVKARDTNIYMGRAIPNEEGKIEVVAYAFAVAVSEVKILIYTRCDHQSKSASACYREISKYAKPAAAEDKHDLGLLNLETFDKFEAKCGIH